MAGVVWVLIFVGEVMVKLLSLMSLFGFSVLLCNILQEKGSNEIVFKAMGRAINKTVTIVELIKVILVTST